MASCSTPASVPISGTMEIVSSSCEVVVRVSFSDCNLANGGQPGVRLPDVGPASDAATAEASLPDLSRADGGGQADALRNSEGRTDVGAQAGRLAVEDRRDAGDAFLADRGVMHAWPFWTVAVAQKSLGAMRAARRAATPYPAVGEFLITG